jgi:DhnA family fructose-bisphosphate aldolase class Ia
MTRTTALDPGTLGRLRDLRAERPEAIAEALTRRRRRPLRTGSEQLLIVAADHPARGALRVGGDESAMADRIDLLGRLAVALANPGVDGVLGSPDIIDDLAALGLLDDRIVIGSMNRGGLRGARFELDDRYTGYRVDAMVAAGIDAAKALVRIDLDDVGTVRTLEATAVAVSEAAAAGLPIMLEPFICRRQEGAVVNDLTPDAVIRSIAIASGLGASSAYTWLKLPVVADMSRVLAATTLPVMLLGGDSGAAPDAAFAAWQHALGLPGVRGLVVGRALLYPPDGDVGAAIATAASLVRRVPVGA